MVLPSDITRWGFEFTGDCPDLEGEINDGGFGFQADSWMIIMNKEANLQGRRLLYAYHEGKPRHWEYISSPKEVFDILKKVGYL